MLLSLVEKRILRHPAWSHKERKETEVLRPGSKVCLRNRVNERERRRRAIGFTFLEVAGPAHLVGHMSKQSTAFCRASAKA